MSEAERISTSRTVAASAADIFAVVRSPVGHVRIDGSGMLVAAEDAEPVNAVGDTFVMHMDREPLGDLPMGKYDVTVVITGFELDRVIEWSVLDTKGLPYGHVYGYHLEPADAATTQVTSFCDWSGLPERRKARASFPVVPLHMLEKSLANLDRIVTTGE